MKKILLSLLLAISVHAENKYDQIHKRNAFDLQGEKVNILPSPPLLPQQPAIKLNLTGIITNKGVTNIYLYAKDHTKKFITLNRSNKSDQGITLLHVKNGRVTVDNNGTVEVLSFATHKLPSVITLPANKPTIVKKKDDKSKSVKITPQTPKANVVTVPSRRPKIDPRIIQRGLEYLDKVEDKEKREYILQRLERLQSGQEKIDRKIETNERRRQYDERRRDK